MFTYKNEDWQITDRTDVLVYAKRPGKRGRPSKFTVQELLDAGVELPLAGVQVALPVEAETVAEPGEQSLESAVVSEPPVEKFDLF